jgi:fatty acid desaturase
MEQRSRPGDGDRPRVEPEIIPPDADRRPWGGRGRRDDGMWTSSDGTHRVYVTRIGPFGFGMAALAAAIMAAIVFFLVLGAFVVLLPFAGLLLAGVIIATFLRGSFRRRW